MSKTDKTQPYNVARVLDGRVQHDHRSGCCIVETFDDAQRGWRYKYYRSPRELRPTCEWTLDRRSGSFSQAPRWFRKTYENSARVVTRDALIAVRKDWNANGETDAELEPIRHRHGAAWDWW